MQYRIEINHDVNCNDINLHIVDEQERITGYSPVIFAVYMIDNKPVYYTESKEGDLKHLYSVNHNVLLDIELIENLSPVYEIIDQMRY